MTAIPTGLSFATDPAAALRFYHKHGYFIERNIWSEAERQELIRASENLAGFQDGTFAPAINPHNDEPAFLKAICNPTIIRIMEMVLSGRVSGLQTEFFHCRPGTPGFALHQDNFYVEARPDAFASVWSPLVDVSAANGTLMIYPGTHTEPILPVEPLPFEENASQDKNARRQQVVVPAKYRPMDVVAAAGDAVLFHGHLVHGSHTNGSEQHRRVLLSTYIRAGEKFRAGFHARRREVDVYAARPLSLRAAG